MKGRSTETMSGICLSVVDVDNLWLMQFIVSVGFLCNCLDMSAFYFSGSKFSSLKVRCYNGFHDAVLFSK